MNRLESELNRLFPPAADDGRVRTMVLELERPANWDALRRVWQGVQADLELPAPAIAVSGVDGYQLWFSLAEAVPATQADDFLGSLCRRYLAEVRPDRIAINPAHAVTPPVETAPGRWSAFVTPDLAALFAEESFLDLPPGLDAQGELLSRLESIKPADWARARERLQAPTVERSSAAPRAAPGSRPADDTQPPKTFLLQIMNDSSIDLHLRIEAAKALLPYFEDGRPL
ncbi:MAG: hypothetical protein JWP41_1832 [Ramlibacter sp.]|nr:hypothetical protein [Ramlibacter sp.]